MRKIALFTILAAASAATVGLTPRQTGACPPWRGHHGYARPVVYHSYAPLYSYAPRYAAPPAVYGAAPPAPMPMPAPTPAPGPEVAALDNVFQPKTINVPAGATVRWTNRGRHPHTVTAADGSFDSGNIAPGASFAHKFDKPGTYKYHCKLHQGMAGTVVVGAAGAGAPAAPGGAPGGTPKGGGY